MVLKPKIAVFASGTKDGGGSGFENLVTSFSLEADIVAVVSTHEYGGVRARAERLGVPFMHFAGTFDRAGYANLLRNIHADWFALSGWAREVAGFDPKRTINIHPALVSFDDGRFGGKGMYGRRIHEAVKAALDAGEISESGFSMHFVTEQLDRGPVFFERRVPLRQGMSPVEIAAAVNEAEHRWQPKVTNLVVHGHIRWDGKDPGSLVVPQNIT